jgi:hypothetical protein
MIKQYEDVMIRLQSLMANHNDLSFQHKQKLKETESLDIDIQAIKKVQLSLGLYLERKEKEALGVIKERTAEAY